MLKGFEGYYPPDFDKLWDEAIFVFDANVLLDLYRSSPKSRQEMLDILESLDGRIWIPHQFFYEYHKHKATIYDDIDCEYTAWENSLQKDCETATSGLKNKLRKIKNRTGFEIDPLDEQVDRIFKEILSDLAQFREQHQSSRNDEPLEEKIAQLFAESYGEPFQDSCLENIKKLAEKRRKKEIPPSSSKDNQKDKSDPDGDLIGWFQTIKYANDEKKSIILVSNDGDWFLRHKGKTKGPHPVLLQEMYDKARVSCYIYKSSQFIKRAKNFLDAQVSDETIEEVENREKYITEQEIEAAYENSIVDKLVDYITRLEEWMRKVQPGQDSLVPIVLLCGTMVLEEAIQHLCERQTPPVATAKPNGEYKGLNALIEDLQKANVFNKLKAQQIRGWVKIRDAANRGRLDEYSRYDVKLMVDGVKNFLADYF